MNFIEKLLKDNQDYLKEITVSKRELRHLKLTIELMQMEINNLYKQKPNQKKLNKVISKIKKLVDFSAK